MLIFTYLEQLEDLARLRTSRAEARPVVEPLAKPEDAENGDAAHCGTALHRFIVDNNDDNHDDNNDDNNDNNDDNNYDDNDDNDDNNEDNS